MLMKDADLGLSGSENIGDVGQLDEKCREGWETVKRIIRKPIDAISMKEIQDLNDFAASGRASAKQEKKASRAEFFDWLLNTIMSVKLNLESYNGNPELKGECEDELRLLRERLF